MPYEYPVPTLSSKGFVYDVAGKCDRLMAYFYTTNKSQTYLYSGNLVSLPALIQQYGRDPNSLCTNIKMSLERYLGAYFDGVNVETSHDANDTLNQGTTYKIRLSAQVTDGGKFYSLANEIVATDSSFLKVIKLVNGEN